MGMARERRPLRDKKRTHEPCVPMPTRVRTEGGPAANHRQPSISAFISEA